MLQGKSIQLECALNDEKCVSGELRSVTEQLRRDLHEMEDKCNKQTRELSEAQHSLTKYATIEVV